MRIVALDLPTSWASINTDETTSRIMAAVNDMLAAIARKDYTDRRRAAEGVEKAKREAALKGEKAFKGHQEDDQRNAAILKLLNAQTSWTEIQKETKCSHSTIKRIKDRSEATA